MTDSMRLYPGSSCPVRTTHRSVTGLPCTADTLPATKRGTSFVSDERIRIIAACPVQVKQHRQHRLPSTAILRRVHITTLATFRALHLPNTLVRELAAGLRLRCGGLRRILLPGASGVEALRTFDTFLQQRNDNLLLVLDNAHRILWALRMFCTPQPVSILCCCAQPHDNVRQLEAMTGLQRESITGIRYRHSGCRSGRLGGHASAGI